MAKDEKAVFWAERIQELRSSGQTMKEWCIEHKISYSTMGYWLRKLAKKESETENELVFAKLPSEREIAGNKTEVPFSSSLQIFIAENIRIEISDSCKPQLLETLLRVLKNNA